MVTGLEFIFSMDENATFFSLSNQIKAITIKTMLLNGGHGEMAWQNLTTRHIKSMAWEILYGWPWRHWGIATGETKIENRDG